MFDEWIRVYVEEPMVTVSFEENRFMKPEAMDPKSKRG